MLKKMVSLSLVLCLMMPISGFAAGTHQTAMASHQLASSKAVVVVATASDQKAKDKAAKEKASKDKAAKEKAAKEKVEKEKADKEKADKAKADANQLEKEKVNLSPAFFTTKQFESKDGLKLTADYYEPQNNKVSDTLIITFHRAGWSRGEYRGIAAFLSANNHAVLAVDMRSGAYSNGVINETAQLAAEKKLPQNHPDASVDMEATIEYATKTLGYKKVILWGSSYSACLSLVNASLYADVITGVIDFSPGEYFTVADKTIASYAEKVMIPTLIFTAPFEKVDAEPIFNALSKNNAKNQFHVIGMDNLHGSSMLWDNIPLAVRKEVWGKIFPFIESLGVVISDKTNSK